MKARVIAGVALLAVSGALYALWPRATAAVSEDVSAPASSLQPAAARPGALAEASDIGSTSAISGLLRDSGDPEIIALSEKLQGMQARYDLGVAAYDAAQQAFAAIPAAHTAVRLGADFNTLRALSVEIAQTTATLVERYRVHTYRKLGIAPS